MALPTPRSPYLAQTDLTLQLSSLRNTPVSFLPRSVYLLPSPLDPLLLDGVVFVGSQGPYAGGVFRFTLRWPSSASRGRKAGAREGPTICFNPTCVPAHPLIQPAAPYRLNLVPLLAQHDEDHPASITLPSLIHYLHQIFQPTYLRDVLASRPDWFTGYNVDVGSMLVKEYGNGRTGGGDGREGKGKWLFDSLARQSVKLSRSRRVLFGDGGAGEDGAHSGIVFPEALLGKNASGAGGGGAESERKREGWMAQLRRDIFYGYDDDDDEAAR